MTNQDVRLEAEFHDGSRILGESKIFYAKKINNSRIRKVRLVPERPAALPESVRAIREADIVVIGPGSLYTSIIPNFLVSGIADAVRQSRALKIYASREPAFRGEYQLILTPATLCTFGLTRFQTI